MSTLTRAAMCVDIVLLHGVGRRDEEWNGEVSLALNRLDDVSCAHGQGNLQERFCGTSHWLAMPARLNFLTDSPARLECFAEAPRNFAGRPEDDGRVFRGPEGCPMEGRGLSG